MGLGKFNFSTMIVLTCVLALGCFLSRAKLLTVLNLSPADLENMLRLFSSVFCYWYKVYVSLKFND